MSWERRTGLLDDALAMLREAERMHQQFFTLMLDRRGPRWEPPVDMVETARGLTLSVALPGVAPDAVDVRTDGVTITVVAVRSLPAGPGETIHRLEIPYGRFERRISLPNGRFELVSRDLIDGCLFLKFRRLG